MKIMKSGSMVEIFDFDLMKIQPSQLYISKKKLAKIYETFKPEDSTTLEVIPIKELDSEIIYTDGHTRAYAAFLAGYTKVSVCWEDEDLASDILAVGTVTRVSNYSSNWVNSAVEANRVG